MNMFINKLKSLIKNNSLLVFSIVLTIVLSLYNHSMGMEILNKFLSTCKSTLPILILMFGLLAFIQIGMNSSKVKNIIEKNNNFKGLIMSYVFGLLVSGPIYPGFTLGKTLIEHGLKSKIIIVMLSTWATIKLPLLPFELKILGLQITLVRWFVTTIAIFIISFICDYLIGRIHNRVSEDQSNVEKI